MDITPAEAPLVSVTVPTYNRWPLVAESIDSVLAQDYPNFEIIVVDDGSTDGTGEHIAATYGDRIEYIWQENQGAAAARNQGIRAARGEYIAFLDSDDTWLPGKLSSQVDALQAHPEAGFVYCKCLCATEDGTPTRRVHGGTAHGVSGDNFDAMLLHGPVLMPALMVRASVFDELGLLDPTLRWAYDTEFLHRLGLAHEGVYQSEPGVFVREHAGRGWHASRRDGSDARERIHTFSLLLDRLPPSHQTCRPVVERLLLEANIELLCSRIHMTGSMEAVRGVSSWVAENADQMEHYSFFEALAIAVQEGLAAAEQRREAIDMLAAAFGDLPRAQRRRRLSSLHSAMSRRAFAEGRTGEALVHAGRALTASPGNAAALLGARLPAAFSALVSRGGTKHLR